MIKKEFTKQEVATFLRDYSLLVSYAVLNPKEKFIDLFQKNDVCFK